MKKDIAILLTTCIVVGCSTASPDTRPTRLTDADIARLEAMPTGFRREAKREAENHNRDLLKWIAVGDSEAWVLRVLGEPDGKSAKPAKQERHLWYVGPIGGNRLIVVIKNGRFHDTRILHVD